MEDKRTPAAMGITGMVCGLILCGGLFMGGCASTPRELLANPFFWLVGAVFMIAGGGVGFLLGLLFRQE